MPRPSVVALFGVPPGRRDAGALSSRSNDPRRVVHPEYCWGSTRRAGSWACLIVSVSRLPLALSSICRYRITTVAAGERTQETGGCKNDAGTMTGGLALGRMHGRRLGASRRRMHGYMIQTRSVQSRCSCSVLTIMPLWSVLPRMSLEYFSVLRVV